MYDTRLEEMALATQREVITLCDYGTCPTIKSNNAINTMIVVKSDGNLRSLETGRDPSDHDNYEPLENRPIGVLPYGR